MDSGTKTSTSEFLKDKDYEDYKDFFLRVTEYQDINVWKEFLEFCSSYCNWMEDFLDKLDEYTDEIDEVITDFLDFWAIARCWLKEWLGLTVENGDDNEEEMEEGQVSIEERTMRGGNKQDRMVGMVELLGEREKPTGEQDVGADYRDDRERDHDQEGDGDQRCRKKNEIGRGAVRITMYRNYLREGRPKHAGGDEDEDEEAPTTNKDMDYEGEEARKVIVAEETVGTVNKQEEVGEEMLSKEEDPDKGKYGSDGMKRSLSNQHFESRLENVENEMFEEEGGRNKRPRLDVCEEAGFEGEGEVVPRQGEESGEGRLTREDLDRLFEDSDDEIERESVGRGKRRRRGF